MRFSIRDLLPVTVIVALAVGWWVDHRRQEAARMALESDAAQMANHLYGWLGDKYVRSEQMERLKGKYYPAEPKLLPSRIERNTR